MRTTIGICENSEEISGTVVPVGFVPPFESNILLRRGGEHSRCEGNSKNEEPLILLGPSPYVETCTLCTEESHTTYNQT